MATKTIFIYATSSNPHPAIIFDSEGNLGNSNAEDKALTTKVKNGDTIIWKVAHGCDITSIDGITMKSGTDLFPSGITKQNTAGTKWEGTIGSNSDGTVESYSITYTVDGKQQYTEDPKLQIHN